MYIVYHAQSTHTIVQKFLLTVMILVLIIAEMIVKDENNDPIIVQKLVALICPHEIFNLVIKPPNEGGFD